MNALPDPFTDEDRARMAVIQRGMNASLVALKNDHARGMLDLQAVIERAKPHIDAAWEKLRAELQRQVVMFNRVELKLHPVPKLEIHASPAIERSPMERSPMERYVEEMSAELVKELEKEHWAGSAPRNRAERRGYGPPPRRGEWWHR